MPTFTYEKTFELDNSDGAFMAAFARVVASRGVEFVYDNSGPSCVNVSLDKNCGECLIGTVLVSLGVPVEWFSAENMVEGSAREVMTRLGFSERVIYAAQRAQTLQDNSNNWGSAADSFYNVYANWSE